MVVAGGAVGFDMTEEVGAAPDVISGYVAGRIGFGEGAFKCIGMVDHKQVCGCLCSIIGYPPDTCARCVAHCT